MAVAVADTPYSRLPAGVAITPTSSIPVARGFGAVVAGAMVLVPECSTRTSAMATAAISAVFVLPCRRSPRTVSNISIFSFAPFPIIDRERCKPQQLIRHFTHVL